MSQADLEASLIRGVRIRVLPGKKKKKGTKKKRRYIYIRMLYTQPGNNAAFPSPRLIFDTAGRKSQSSDIDLFSLSFSPSRNIFIGFERYFVVSLVTISQGINRGGNCFLDERNSSLNRILVREFLSPRAPFNPKNLNHHLPSEKSPSSCIFVKLYSRGDI